MDPLTLKMTQLKRILQQYGLPTMGTKTELIARMQEKDSTGVWIAEAAVLMDIDNEENLIQIEDTGALRGTNEQSVIHVDVPRRDLPVIKGNLTQGQLLSQALAESDGDAESYMEAVMRLYIRSNSRILMSEIESISEPLSKFDGSNDFECWKAQVNLLRNKYELDEDASNILIRSRLHGDAKEWYYSHDDNFDLKVDDLLEKMDAIFTKQLRKLERRKQFEVRQWKETETFSEYCHDKMILGNQVPIAEDEMVDYILDGIPSETLRNQAQIYSSTSVHELLKGFHRMKLTTVEATASHQQCTGNQYPKPVSNADDMLKKKEEIHCVKRESRDELQSSNLPTKEDGYWRESFLSRSQRRLPMRFPCSKCDQVYSSEPQLRRHLTNELYELEYICKSCHKSFKQINNFKRHIKVVHVSFLDIQGPPWDSIVEIRPNPHYPQ